jgi:hypothetical protein
MKIILVLIGMIGLTFGLAVSADSTSSTNNLKEKAPRVYIYCDYCDLDFIRTEITFVNYVIDRKEAEIHILITHEHSGSGGQQYTLTFIGLQKYKDMNDTLKLDIYQDDTEDIGRRKLVQVLKLGLMRYMARTPLAQQININIAQGLAAQEVRDKWNYWLFQTSIYSDFNGEQSYQYLSLNGKIKADRITEKWKMKLSLGTNYTEENFDIEDSTLNSYTRSQYLDGLVVKSLSRHWSAGISAGIHSSTYNNLASSFSLEPALEYNVFPYSESTRRELRILYNLGYRYNKYEEETIYNKTEEGLIEEELTTTLELKQPWGTVEINVSASHYLHDFSKNYTHISSEIDLRLFKGFSLEVYGAFSRIHDQLSLPKGEISTEEILLRRRQMETQYYYWASIGFSYSFGSIYNNIVNPRFGN